MSELDEAQALIYGYLARSLQKLADGADGDQSLMTTIAYYYRLRGIAAYLRGMDEAAFVGDLYNAGRARLEYLRACVATATDDGNYRTALRNLAYFDALAVHDLATATELATACLGRWNAQTQYEDDFLWMEFLQAALVAPDAEASLLDRYRDRIDGDNPFLDCCQSLHARDGESFAAAVEQIARIRQANFESKRDPPDLPVLILATEPYVDVQGLAVCRLAQLRGMAMPVGIPSLPESLLELPKERCTYPVPQAWRTI